jgi:multiple sugar transport system permease protein
MLKGNADWAGLANYQTLFTHDPIFYKALMNSLIFTVGIVTMNVSLALILSLLLYQSLKGMTLFRTLFFSPVVTSTVAWVLVWSFMMQNDNGTINQLLALIGIKGPNWLHESGWAMFSVIFVRVIKNVGLNMVILLAAIKDLPQEYMEAARVDGANSWQVFRRIMLPLLAPALILVTMLTVIGSMSVFDHILVMTNGGPANATLVLAFYVYFQAFRVREIGYASSIAVILFLIILCLTVLQWLLRKRFDYHEN